MEHFAPRGYDRGHIDWYMTAFWLLVVPAFSLGFWALAILYVMSWFK